MGQTLFPVGVWPEVRGEKGSGNLSQLYVILFRNSSRANEITAIM